MSRTGCSHNEQERSVGPFRQINGADKMSKGYLLFAVDTDTIDYTRLAYACALSIKITQPEGYNTVALVTNNLSKVKSGVFDTVIEYTGPTGMDSRSRALDYTPYDETVLLDSDMIMLTDMSHYWDIVSDRDLFITTCAQTYRRQLVKYGYYREIFEKNKLADAYNAWTYFKKDSKTAIEFFDMVKLITDHPEPFIAQLEHPGMIKSLPTDEAFAIALRVLDIEDNAINSNWDFPRITHMKPMIQNWYEDSADWTDRLRLCITPTGETKLGVWQQTDLLHYVDKTIITDKIIKLLETLYE
jgi:hypothetical protein